ncbi:MAG: hypothetical protein ACRDHY_16950, partial [Anaerolineales bacterium]
SMPALPVEIERIIARCLRKDMDRRFQHAGDLKIVLAELKEDTESGRTAPGAVPRGRPAFKWLALAAILVALTAGLTWWLARSRVPVQGLSPVRVTADPGLTAYPAISPDGRLLCYASDRGSDGNLDLWVQQVGGASAPIRLTRHESDDYEPSFSPDGTRIVFRSERDGGGVYAIPALGGEERRIADHGRNPRFSPDGALIAYWTGDPSVFSRGRLYVLAAAGGQPRQIEPDFFSGRYPCWSPDGKRLLFFGLRSAPDMGLEAFEWWMTSLGGEPEVATGARKAFEQHRVTPLGRELGEWTGNRVVFSAGPGDTASLYQVPISARTGKITGPPQRLTFGTGQDLQPSASVAPSKGRLVFASTSGNADLWSLAIAPNQGKVSGDPQRITSSAAADAHPSVSADGQKIAFVST